MKDEDGMKKFFHSGARLLYHIRNALAVYRPLTGRLKQASMPVEPQNDIHVILPLTLRRFKWYDEALQVAQKSFSSRPHLLQSYRHAVYSVLYLLIYLFFPGLSQNKLPGRIGSRH